MERNRSFQGLRGIFAIGVLLSHCAFTKDYSIWNVIKPLSDVSFFFMLSGYFLYLTFKPCSITSFLKKKLIKIYPLHVCMLMLMIAVKLFAHTFEFTLNNAITVFLHLCLLQTWVPDVSISTAYNTVSWFLSSLLFCYIIGYLILSGLKQNHPRGGKIVRRVIILLFLILKIIAAVIFPTGNGWGYYLAYLCPLAALPDFLLGFEIADCCNNLKLDEKRRIAFQLVAVALIIIMFATKHLLPSNYTRGFYCIPYNVVLIISMMKETEFSKRTFGNKALLWLGGISFEIYLIHDILITALSKYVPVLPKLCAIQPLVAVAFVIVCSIACAFVYQRIVALFKNNRNKI